MILKFAQNKISPASKPREIIVEFTSYDCGLYTLIFYVIIELPEEIGGFYYNIAVQEQK